jgi:hypothetical protein
LISNDFFREAAEKPVSLEEEDSTTFAHFVEWAYNTSYRVHARKGTTNARAEENDQVQYTSIKKPYGNLGTIFCTQCGTSFWDELGNFPFCAKCAWTHRCVGCGIKLNREENRAYVCPSCSESFDVDPVDICATPSYRVERFKRKEYPVDGISHKYIRNSLESVIPIDEASNNLLADARLFVFADKWLISPLKELTLHKWRRDL